MRWIVASGRELIGLFVDDGSLVVVALIWLALCGLLLDRLGLPEPWRGAVLFGGLALGLVENALRGARERRRP
jgi:hypothetical protein